MIRHIITKNDNTNNNNTNQQDDIKYEFQITGY